MHDSTLHARLHRLRAAFPPSRSNSKEARADTEMDSARRRRPSRRRARISNRLGLARARAFCSDAVACAQSRVVLRARVRDPLAHLQLPNVRSTLCASRRVASRRRRISWELELDFLFAYVAQRSSRAQLICYAIAIAIFADCSLTSFCSVPFPLPLSYSHSSLVAIPRHVAHRNATHRTRKTAAAPRGAAWRRVLFESRRVSLRSLPRRPPAPSRPLPSRCSPTADHSIRFTRTTDRIARRVRRRAPADAERSSVHARLGARAGVPRASQARGAFRVTATGGGARTRAFHPPIRFDRRARKLEARFRAPSRTAQIDFIFP